MLYIHVHCFIFLLLNKLTDFDGVVYPIEQRPVKVVTVVLIPSTQSIFKVT